MHLFEYLDAPVDTGILQFKQVSSAKQYKLKSSLMGFYEDLDRIRIESDRVYYQEKKPDLLFFYDTLRKIPSEQFEKEKRQNKSKTAEQQTFKE
jgi:hypothetical protein